MQLGRGQGLCCTSYNVQVHPYDRPHHTGPRPGLRAHCPTWLHIPQLCTHTSKFKGGITGSACASPVQVTLSAGSPCNPSCHTCFLQTQSSAWRPQSQASTSMGRWDPRALQELPGTPCPPCAFAGVRLPHTPGSSSAPGAQVSHHSDDRGTRRPSHAPLAHRKCCQNRPCHRHPRMTQSAHSLGAGQMCGRR